MRFLRTFVGSFYSPAVYAEARVAQPGLKLLYTLVLVMICCAVVVINGAFFVHRILLQSDTGGKPLADRVVMDLARQVPRMVLEPGKITVSGPQPVIMTLDAGDAKHTRFALITIDTTGHTTVQNMPTPLLITAQEIYAKGKTDTRVYALKDYTQSIRSPLIINRALATDTAERLLGWLHGNAWKLYLLVGIPAWLMFTFVAYILRVFMLLVLSLVGMLASQIFKPTVSFRAGIQFAAVAFTPVAVADTLLLSYLAHPLSMFTLFALGVVMVCIGLFVSRNQQHSTPSDL